MNIRSSLWLVQITFLCLSGCKTSDNFEPVADNPDPFRLAADVQPVLQTLDLNIDPEQTDYSGSTTITIDVLTEQPELRLHAQDLQIEQLRLTRGDEVVDVAYKSGEHGLLIISAANPLAAGSYTLQIDFSNDFNTDGVGINRTENEGRYYVFSQFEAIDARRAFPCFDEPGFKLPWQLSITVPTDVLAITNTPEESVTRKAGQVTTVFVATPPLPSYLIAVAVGPFEIVPIDGMSVPGRVIVPQGESALAATAVETTPPLLVFLEDYFGEPYPFKKLDLIATYQSFAGAMEHPGAITYSDFFLLLDETASADQKQTLVKITAHELAHQWFGNLVTMRWWDDLWLNESFADWMGDKTVEAVYPEFASDVEELRTIFRIMDVDLRPTTRPIRHEFKATDNFEDGVFLSYYKGKAVLSMFEESVGEDVFREGVVRYLRKFSRGNAEADDLWASIDAGAEIDLAGGLASFIDQPGIPLVSVSQLDNGAFEFSQRRLSSDDTAVDAQSWIFPVVYSYLTSEGVQRGEVYLDSEREVVDLGSDVAWILPGADARGYYRWNIPVEMLSRLGEDTSRYLNVRERMGLLSNLWALLATDQLDGEDFLATIRGFATDTDAAVLSALLDQLGNVNQTFITPDLRDQFALYLQDLLLPTLERIGTDPVSGEGGTMEALRSQLLLWLADYGHDATARAVVNDYTNRYLAGDIVASDQVSVAMRAAARLGDKALFDRFRKGFEASTSPNDRQRYAMAIGSFRDPDVVAEVLDYAMTGPLQTIELATVLQRLAGWADNHPMLLQWLMAHDKELRERLPENAMARIPDSLTRCSTEHLQTLIDFYGAAERFVPGIESELADSEAEVLECAAFRQREIDSVRQYLNNSM